MLGAIIGDIVGSRFEFDNYRNTDFELFEEECEVTDDTAMTLAVAKALMESVTELAGRYGDFDWQSAESEALVKSKMIQYMQEIGRQYPYHSYGARFGEWLYEDDPQPYNSYGNGAAMRISPVGFFAQNEEHVKALSHYVTAVTHDHPEGLKGAEATAMAILWARAGLSKDEIKARIEASYYPLRYDLEQLRKDYAFNETCQETVPQALYIFIISNSFEDTLRNAISIGGDSDTLAAITMAVAEAFYGVPEDLKDEAEVFLDQSCKEIYNAWYQFVGTQTDGRHILASYLGRWLEVGISTGFTPKNNRGSKAIPIYMELEEAQAIMEDFLQALDAYVKVHPQLKASPEQEGEKGLLDQEAQIIRQIVLLVRTQRQAGANMLELLKNDQLLPLLKQLVPIKQRDIVKLEFSHGGFHGGFEEYELVFGLEGAHFKKEHLLERVYTEKEIDVQRAKRLKKSLEKLGVDYWNKSMVDRGVMDGTQWYLKVTYINGDTQRWSGSNAFPHNWPAVKQFWKRLEN